MPVTTIHTATEINRILDMPDDAEIGTAYLDRFPIDLYTPSPDSISHFLREYGNITGDKEHSDLRAYTLHCAISLAHAYDRDKPMIRERRNINNPAKIASILRPMLRDLTHEELITVALDTKKNVIDHWTTPTCELRRKDTLRKVDIKGTDKTFKGTLNASVIHAREIYRFAIEKAADSIVIAHNHPSGDLTPSLEDINATKQVKEAGKIIGIELIDHIIIGKDGDYLSMREESII